jgi:hypothetical protein
MCSHSTGWTEPGVTVEVFRHGAHQAIVHMEQRNFAEKFELLNYYNVLRELENSQPATGEAWNSHRVRSAGLRSRVTQLEAMTISNDEEKRETFYFNVRLRRTAVSGTGQVQITITM